MQASPTDPQSSVIKNRLEDVRTILFPTDFSEASHNAFTYALHLAESFDARIVLLHVYSMVPVDKRFVPAEFMQALEDEKVEHALTFMRDYHHKAQAEVGTRVEIRDMILSGYADREIIRLSQEEGYDMVVMGTLGAASQAQKAFGSVTTKVIAGASCPVLMIPEEVRYTPLKRMAYAMAGDSKDPVIIEQLIEFCECMEAQLSCVHIRANKGGWDEIDEAQFEQLEAWEKMGKLGIYIAKDEEVILGLDHYITQHQVDMLAMLTHKRLFLETLNNKSLTKEMALFADTPLLVLHDF